MNEIIGRFFSKKYVNHAAVADNFLLMLMYRAAYPFAYLLNRAHLSPNQITTCSLLCSVFAFLALVYAEGWLFFSMFWAGSVLFDFCDGTVARMTNRVSKSAFRYDHMSDIFKICLVVLGVAIRNDDVVFWILCSILIFTYTYSELVDHDLRNALARAENRNALAGQDIQPVLHRKVRTGLAGFVKRNFPRVAKVLINLYGIVIGFNGHTLLVFFALPFGGLLTIIILLYLIFLTLITAFRGINTLCHMSR